MEIEKYNSMEAVNDSFYVVVKGRKVGLYTTWEEANEQVNRFPDNLHIRVVGKNDALGILKDGLECRLLREKLLSKEELEVLEFCRKHHDTSGGDFPSIF